MTLAVSDAGAPDVAQRAGLPASVTVTTEVLEHMSVELPALAHRGKRDRLLLATWLVGLRSPRTRRAYLSDVVGWLDWLLERDVDVLESNDQNLWMVLGEVT